MRLNFKVQKKLDTTFDFLGRKWGKPSGKLKMFDSLMCFRAPFLYFFINMCEKMSRGMSVFTKKTRFKAKNS